MITALSLSPFLFWLSSHVHAGVLNRDAAVQVGDRAAPGLPLVLPSLDTGHGARFRIMLEAYVCTLRQSWERAGGIGQ